MRGCREILSAAGVAGSKECAERDREAEEGAEEAGPDQKTCTVSLGSGTLGERCSSAFF